MATIQWSVSPTCIVIGVDGLQQDQSGPIYDDIPGIWG